MERKRESRLLVQGKLIILCCQKKVAKKLNFQTKSDNPFGESSGRYNAAGPGLFHGNLHFARQYRCFYSAILNFKRLWAVHSLYTKYPCFISSSGCSSFPFTVKTTDYSSSVNFPTDLLFIYKHPPPCCYIEGIVIIKSLRQTIHICT